MTQVLHQLFLFLFTLFSTTTTTVAKLDIINTPKLWVPTSLANYDGRWADAWSEGGGEWWTIGSDSSHPFVGRDFGGGKRDDIRGTRAYGSGYPYGNKDASTISGRPFPFGFWPLYWDQDFMGCDEYGPQFDVMRPGGQLVTIPLKSTTQWWEVAENEVYYAIGDRDSVLSLMISLVTKCHVTPTWPSKFDPTSPNSTIKIENVIRYYRASSFSLASPGYNNTFARTANATATDSESTPLPSFINSSSFYKCLDATTKAALAIVNKPHDKTAHIRWVMTIVFGVCGIPILGVTLCLCGCCVGCFKGTKEQVRQRRERKEREEEVRLAMFAYENYP